MKTAYTIEEYTEMGNTLYLVDSTEDVPVQYFIDTTDKLLEHLRALGSQRILKTVFLDSRKVYRPTCPWQKRQLIDYRTLEDLLCSCGIGTDIFANGSSEDSYTPPMETLRHPANLKQKKRRKDTWINTKSG